MLHSRKIRRAVLLIALLSFAVFIETGCGGGGSASISTPASGGGSSTTPTPGVTLSGTQLIVTTSSLQATFNQAALISLKNRQTNESYVVSPGPNWLDLTLLENNGQDLTPGNWAMNADNTASLQFTDSQRTITMTVGVADDDMFLRFEGTSTAPGALSITWGILGLNLSPGRLVIPAQGGTYFDAVSKPDFQGLDYPVHWENQMVVYQGAQGSVLLYANDPVPTYKRLHASKQTGALDMAVEMFAPGPCPTSTTIPRIEWRMRAFKGDWKPAADAYKNYMSSLRPFVPADGKKAWIKNIRGVVIFQSLDYTVLDQLAQEVIPDKTILHIVNWRQQPFDFDYPDYTPDPGSVAFVQRAHQLGFRVMLHVNLLGVSEVNPEYQNVKQCQIKTADELAPIGWLWDEFPAGDPHRVAYISPACSAYRKLFVSSIKPAIDALHPDALHLDAGGAIVNDGNGLIEGMNGMQGITQLHKDLLAAYPDLVFGGESTNEIIAPFNWLAQRWPANSPAHPISTYMMGSQVFFYGFLDQPGPEDSSFPSYLSRYEGLGVVPVAFVITSTDLGPDQTRTHQILSYMKTLQTGEFSPDWAGDWNNVRFRQKSSDAKSQLIIQDDGTFVNAKQDGTILYQRAHDANSFTTPLFIDNWPAYDSTRLIGTDPSNQYWLNSTGSRPSGETHLSQLPVNFQIGQDTVRTDKYSLFEIAGVSENWFDFVADLPGALMGTIYNLQEYKVINGAVIKVGRARVGGVLYDSLIFEHPPYKQALGGSAFFEYNVPIPVAPKVLLTFSAALVDGSDQSDGVTFGIQLNGTTAWKQTVLPSSGWAKGSIDVTKFAGQKIKVRFLTHPGPALNANYDSACWNDIKLVTDYSTTANVQVELVPTSGTPMFTPNARLNSMTGQSASVAVSMPGTFAVFTQPPPTPALGQSLLDYTPSILTVWKTSEGGLPMPTAYENSGTIGPVSSAQVTKTAVAAIPPRRGKTELTTAITVPPTATMMTVGYGLADAPAGVGAITSYSGVIFSVRVNGTEIFRQSVNTAGWNQAQVNISAWSGQPVVFEFIADADQNQLFDFSYFTDLVLQ